MRLLLPMLVVCIVSSTGCGVKHPPMPVYGVDIKAVNAGEVVPFKGTLFSDFYLEQYLQWKDAK
jgi:hypothetical protein